MSDLVGADDVTAWNLSREKKDEIIFHRTLFPLDFLKLKQDLTTFKTNALSFAILLLEVPEPLNEIP